MALSFLEHKFSKDEETWLRHIADSDTSDPRIARAELFSQLSKDFDPSQIDFRFYKQFKLTVLGLRRFNPNARILIDAHKVAEATREIILEKIGIQSLPLSEVCARIGLKKNEVFFALRALEEVAYFSSHETHREDGGLETSISLSGSYGYDAALKYTALDDALDHFYKEQGGYGSILRNRIENQNDNAILSSSRVLQKKRSTAAYVKKDSVFVIMAIDPSKPDLVDVLEAIKSVSSSFGISAYRADEIEHQDVITDVILEQIRDCEYLIADLSYERPNVYYEIGYAHALNKKPILYRRTGTKLHFDLAVHNVSEYANVTELRELLKKRFEAILGRSASV